MFDGDQYKAMVPDFSEVLEKDKNEKYYKQVFKKCVGIDTKNIDWCPDGNAKAGRINKEQEMKMIIQYLEFFKKNIFFLPQQIPEDIVYNENYIMTLTMMEKIPESVLQSSNSKAKIKKWSEESGLSLQSIEAYLVYGFIKNKNEMYQDILSKIKKMMGE